MSLVTATTRLPCPDEITGDYRSRIQHFFFRQGVLCQLLRESHDVLGTRAPGDPA